MNNNYIKGLDGLRAIAISWVMLAHVSAASKWNPNGQFDQIFQLISNTGWIGVQLFFVISGFLITKILLENKNRPKALKFFFIRRSLRIFPIYYFSLFLAFFIYPIVFEPTARFSCEQDNQVWFWLYLNNWTRAYIDFKVFPHLWSLAIEEQFYLIWPFIVTMLSRSRMVLVTVLMIFSAPIFRFYLYYHFPVWGEESEIGARAAYNFTFARWDSIAIGSLLAIFSSKKQTIEWLGNKALAIGAVLVFLIGYQTVMTGGFAAVSSGFGLFSQTLSAFLSGLILVVVLNNKWSISVRVLEQNFIRVVGKYSYAMYIFHLPIMLIWISCVKPIMVSNVENVGIIFVLVNYVSVFLLSFAIAALSWRYIESPILSLKTKFSY